MASTTTTSTSERRIANIPKGIDKNNPLFKNDLDNLQVEKLTIGDQIVLGTSTTGLVLTTTAATPATVLRFDTARVGADGDVQRLSFRAWNDANVMTEYAQINVQLNDVTAATFDGSFELACMVAGTMTTVFDSNVTAAGVVTTTIPSGDLIINDALVFNSGVVSTATEYAVLRNADGTNLLQLNVPTGASIEFSVNNTTEATLSATIFDLTANALTTTGNIGIGAAAGAANKITSAVGTITTAAEVFTGTGTWNAAGVTFDAITVAVTDTASAAASRLLNLSVGGASQLSVTKAGAVTSAGAYTGTTGNFTAATNQLVLLSGAAATTTITAPAPAASRVVTIPDGGAASSVVLTESAQTINGAKNFTGLQLDDTDSTFHLNLVSTGTLTADRTLTFDAEDGARTLRLAGDFITSGAFATTITVTGATGVTLPTSGTLYGTLAASITSAQLLASMTDETGTGALVFANTPTFVTPTLGVASATSLATSAATPLLLTNGQLVNVALTAQTVGATTLTIPNFASVADTFVFTTLSQTLTNKILTAPAITGGTAIELTGLSIRSSGAAFDQLFATATVFTADRTLNFAIGDADRTLTMTGNATLNQDVSTTANPTFVNLTITSFAANWTNAGRTVADAGILTTVDINGGSIDGTTIGAAATSTIVGTTIDATTDFTIGSLVITSNILTATGRLTTAMTVPTVDTGFNGAQTALWAPEGRKGAAGPVVTEFIVDLTNLIGSTTDLDIIGDGAGVANCNFGQITAAVQGTIVAMEMVCLEAPAGGPTDIDVYSAVEATGAEDTAITALTETAIITSGAGWTNGRVLGGTALPAANEYMYLAVGVGGVPGTYTAGKFLIRFYGTV